MGKVHVYMCLQIASVNSTAANKIRFFTSPFLIPTGWFLNLAEAFWDDHVAACRTSLRSATEKDETDVYVAVLCSSKVIQRSSTADWPNFLWRYQFGYDGTHTEQIFNFKTTL